MPAIRNKRCSVGVDHSRGGGTVVHGQGKAKLGGGVSVNVHSQRTFGGADNGAQSVGGGLNYKPSSGPHGGVNVIVHGQKTVSGPDNGAQSVGGGLNYNHPSGLHGGVDGTHHKDRKDQGIQRDQGNQFSANVGGSRRLEPGTLSLNGNVTVGRGKPKTNVVATYSVRF